MSAVRPADRVHLMLEEELVAEMQGLKRVGHAATKFGSKPVFEAKTPSDGAGVQTNSVLYSGTKFVMWYQSLHPTADGRSYHTLNGYAASTDGIHWERPRLGIFRFRSSTDNNLVFSGRAKFVENATVLVGDDDPDPDRRFKMFCTGPGYSLFAFTSPDGIRWTEVPGNPVENQIYRSDVVHVTWIPWQRRYLAFCKFDIPAAEIPKELYRRTVSKWGRVQRLMATGDQKTLSGWKAIGLGPAGEVFGRGDPDWPMHQPYGCVPVCYQGNYLGMLWIYHAIKEDDGSDAEWVYSRDGRNWRRTSHRERIVRRGGKNDWDSRNVYTHALVPRDDELYIYYSGKQASHGLTGPRERARSHFAYKIGLAKLRRDGFVSIRPIDEEGALQTVSVPCAGKQLLVNADARGGQLRVEIQDEQGRPVPGFTLQECQPIRGDSVRHHVAWRAGTDLAALRGKNVRLRIQLRNASLYSFRFVDVQRQSSSIRSDNKVNRHYNASYTSW